MPPIINKTDNLKQLDLSHFFDTRYFDVSFEIKLKLRALP
jgi:hypothetical protein